MLGEDFSVAYVSVLSFKMLTRMGLIYLIIIPSKHNCSLKRLLIIVKGSKLMKNFGTFFFKKDLIVTSPLKTADEDMRKWILFQIFRTQV